MLEYAATPLPRCRQRPAHVAAEHVDQLVADDLISLNTEAPASVSLVKNPLRSECPAKVAGSTPALSARRLTVTAALNADSDARSSLPVRVSGQQASIRMIRPAVAGAFLAGAVPKLRRIARATALTASAVVGGSCPASRCAWR